jgi:hypothetical protein
MDRILPSTVYLAESEYVVASCSLLRWRCKKSAGTETSGLAAVCIETMRAVTSSDRKAIGNRIRNRFRRIYNVLVMYTVE